MPRNVQNVADLAGRFSHFVAKFPAPEIVANSLRNPMLGRLAVVSSFGADSAVLLHMVAQAAPETPVLFIDTRLLFEETLDYQRKLARDLGLSDVRVLRARHLDLAWEDTSETLHKTNPDACCALRKTRVLERALIGFDGWITGRKRHQSSTRAALPHVETEGNRLKINPLADWSANDVRNYAKAQDLPPHPLVARGFPSIGCAPCTSAVQDGEDPRSGRWRDTDKEECGIHFINGRMVRGAASTSH